MTSYDQFFKKLLQEFFPDFLRLTTPDLAPRLDLEAVRFLDKQSFTDWPEGDRREMDLLAEVKAASGVSVCQDAWRRTTWRGPSRWPGDLPP